MKTLGIIGGMGPAATVDLFAKILAATDAATDKENIPILIDNNTAIPDRTKAILHGGESPLPALTESAQRLERAGAELLMLACNTSHYFYDALAARVSVPILHMPRETAKAAREAGYAKVALLATDGTCATGVYQKAFAAEAPETELLYPLPEEQRLVMELIYDNVKANRWDMPRERLLSLLSRLTERGAEAFILGCTELPMAFLRYEIAKPTLDATEALARAAVLAAGAVLREKS